MNYIISIICQLITQKDDKIAVTSSVFVLEALTIKLTARTITFYFVCWEKPKIVYIIVANDWIEANMFHFSSSISRTMSNDDPVNNLCQISQCFCAAGGGIETRPFSQVPARDFPFCLFLNKTWGMKSRSGDRNQSSWTSCDHLRTIRQSQTQKRTYCRFVLLCTFASSLKHGLRPVS